MMVVARPPLGILASAAYLALWALTLAVVSIFMASAAISSPQPLTWESLVVALASIPILQALAILSLTAAYGLATAGRGAWHIAQWTVVANAIVLVSALLLGVHSLGECVGIMLNVVLLAAISWYLKYPHVRQFLETAVNTVE